MAVRRSGSTARRPRATADPVEVGAKAKAKPKAKSRIEAKDKVGAAAAGDVQGSPEVQAVTPKAPAIEVPSGMRLAAALSAYGTSASSARAGVIRALSTELLLPTRVEAEELASALMAKLKAGKSIEAQDAVARALDSSGPLAVAELCAALAWRIGAAAADGAGAALIERSGAALDAIAAAGVQLLATRTPADSRDALATTIAQSALISGGQTLDTNYYAPADGSYAHHFDAFTNERSLPDAIAALPARGGATVGVSGGALQTAVATRADAAIIADINPEVRDFAIVLGATAMLLDDRAQAEGWSDERLGQELQQRLLGADRGGAGLLDELRALGLPEPMLARTSAMLKGLYNDSGCNQRFVWLSPKGVKLETLGVGTAKDDAEVGAHVRQLAALTRGGGLVAPVVDLSDPDAPQRLGAFLQARGTVVTGVHLSNTLDYVLDPRGVVDHLAALPHAPDAVVLSSTAGYGADRRLGDWHSPGVNSLETWLEPGGIREKMSVQAGRLWSRLFAGAFLLVRVREPSFPPDVDLAQVRANFERFVADYYAVDRQAYGSLLCALGLGAWMHQAHPEKWDAQIERLRQLGVPPPRSPDEVRALARALRPLLGDELKAVG